MKKILILGSLPKSKQETELYKSIIKITQKFGVTKSPIDTVNFKGTGKEKYKRAFKLVNEADLIIGEQSQPSTGQGMEIREAAILKKPLIIIAKENSKISGLVKGCPTLKKIIYYKNLENLQSKLEKIISKF